MGKAYAPEIEKQMGGRIENLTIQNYLDGIGQNLAAVSHKPPNAPPYYEYHFIPLEDESVNAFALPGGYVFITRGMLEKLENEGQLASVLAHEIVHIVARHSAEMISKEIGFSIAMSVISQKASGTAATAADIGRQIIGLKFSRADEIESDSGGLDYMVLAGYDPYQMVETMKMLQNQNETRPIEFFSTHPSPENRIEYITQAIQTRGYDSSQLKINQDDYEKSVLNELKN